MTSKGQSGGERLAEVQAAPVVPEGRGPRRPVPSDLDVGVALVDTAKRERVSLCCDEEQKDEDGDS